MSSFSTIYYDETTINLTSTAPAIYTDFWVSGLIINTGIKSLICYLATNCNTAGAIALDAFIVEDVIRNDGTTFRMPIAKVSLNSTYGGGILNNARYAIIFNSIGTVNNAPTIPVSPLGVGASTAGLIDASGVPLQINNSASKGAVSTVTYFPEKFRILYQNVAGAAGDIGYNMIRVIK